MIKELIKNCKLKNVNCPRGFTLIELLIVIAIIGILATLLMVNFVGVRERARDAQRKSDIRQIQSALEIYRADQGVYPVSGQGLGAFPTTCSNALTDVLGNTFYMAKVPCDPNGTSYYNSGNYLYTPKNSNGAYDIQACLENKGDKQGISSPITLNCSSGFYFVVSNP